MIRLSENGKWKNGKTGMLNKDEGYFRLRFIEMNKSMDKFIYRSEERETKCPIVATGFTAYLIETLQTNDKISSTDIYEKYFNYQYQSYLDKVKILPDYNESKAKEVFIKTYIIDEKKHVENSKSLYDYLYDDKVNLIKKYVESYFKYIAEKQTTKTSTQTKASTETNNSKRQEPTDEGLEVIKSYFKGKFYGINSEVNYFENHLKPDLKKTRDGNGYATIALLIQQCEEVNKDKMPPKFSVWYEIFCKNMNIKLCTYKPHQLDISFIQNEFYYLHPRPKKIP